MTHDNDNNPTFKYTDERFADIQMLRYRLDGFNSLTLTQKQLVYCLTEAALWGRDITFHQFGRYNLRIRQLLETIYLNYKGPRTTPDFLAFEEYLKRIWFANGIYHHYGNNKFQPRFSQQFLTTAAQQTGADLTDELIDVIFNPLLLPTKVNKSDGQDLVATSAVNFYENLTQQEVETFYNTLKEKDAEKQKTPQYANSDTP